MENQKFFQSFTLKDGRKLGYAEYGNPEKKPVFYFHGFLGGRFEANFGGIFDKKVNCHLISLDRPGIGLSDFQEGREILDWPNDVAELADHLGYEKFHILGVSGGGPYAASCAYKIPERIYTAGIVAGMGPYKTIKKLLKNPNKSLFFLIDKFPFLLGLVMRLMAKRFLKMEFNEKTSKSLAKTGKSLPEPDRKLYEDKKFQEFLIFHMKDVLQQGFRGASHEGKLLVKPWDFSLEDISKDLKFYVWHGELDINVPIEVGKHVASRIPNCETIYYSEEAHVSVVANKIEEILEKLTEG